MKTSSRNNHDSVSLTVRVVPQSSRSAIQKGTQEELKVYLHSPPADNRANTECIKLLSKFFSIPKSEIEILRGAKSRTKTCTLNGINRDYVNRKINSL